jgi:hypothetical protein
MQSLIEVTIARTHMTHKMMLEVTERLTEAQFCWEPGPLAPPIGWHLWHMARWADRIQAAWFSYTGVPKEEMWEQEAIALRWEVDPATLGTLQTGMSMEHQNAVRLVQEVGMERHLDYARRCFDACDAAIDRFQPKDFDTIYTSVKAYRINEQRLVVYTPPAQVTLASDIMFHLHHASRHLGMIEGLIGAQGVDGTASA